jgi:hypothetical protein
MVLAGLILAIANPDGIAAKRAVTKTPVPTKTKPAPKAEKPASSTFQIVEDEGC